MTTRIVTFAIVLVFAFMGAATAVTSSDWDDLPVKQSRYGDPPEGWHRTKVESTGVDYACPCAAEPHRVQEKSDVLGYSCEFDEIIFLVMVAPLGEPEKNAAQQARWMEAFSVLLFEDFRKRAAESGRDLVITPTYRVSYHGAQGRELTIAGSDRKGVVRILAGKNAVVSMQVLSTSLDPGQSADRFFDSLRLE